MFVPNSKVFDYLSWLCLIALPGIGSAYALLSLSIGSHWRYSTHFMGVLFMVDLILGIIVQWIKNSQSPKH